MMSFVQQALKILGDTEASLRKLINRALAEQKYSDVALMARIADTIAHLRRGVDLDPIASMDVRTLRRSSEGSPAEGTLPQRPQKLQRDPRQLTAEFPHFARDGDKLVKIGWSKRDERVYEHRAPREIVLLTIAAISTKVKSKDIFTMDQILPLKDGAENEVPSYQAYLALAWLRSLGLVQRKGKQGYALAKQTFDDTALQRLWNSVPDRR
jgi:hypothetical protein